MHISNMKCDSYQVAPPCLDPISYIISVMQRAKPVRTRTPPHLWKDLLHRHDVKEGTTNPASGTVIDVIDIFLQFDADTFPCALRDTIYGGIGSTFVLLERAMALDHVLTHESLPGSSERDTMNCPGLSPTQLNSTQLRLASRTFPSRLDSTHYTM